MIKQSVKVTSPEVPLQATKNYCHDKENKVGICIRVKQYIFVFYYESKDIRFFDYFEYGKEQEVITGIGKLYDDELYLVNIILIDSTNYVMTALSKWYHIDRINLFQQKKFNNAAFEIYSDFFNYFQK